MSQVRGRSRGEEVAPARVLVVDDEAVLRDVLCGLLQQPGRELVAVSSAAEALEVARKQVFSAALIDKNLTGGPGLELARALRDEHPDLEVILMSGYASVESAVEAVKLGAFDYVVKPIDDYASLSLRLQNAIDKSTLRRRERELMRNLLESELRYRTLFEATPDALLVVDKATGRFEDANRSALSLYGYSASELSRLGPQGLLAPGDEGALLRRHRRSDGTTFAAEVTSSRFQLGGRTLETLSVRDATARERSEQEQRALMARLRQSQKMEAIGRLAGGVAHDFNNLLAVVQAHADFLGDVLPEGGAARAEVEGIVQAAARGAALTRQLLTFSRPKRAESGTLTWNGVVQEMQPLLARVLGPHVHLVLQLEPAPWLVSADADQLGQVLVNLAINARDAMPQGGTIAVRTENVALEAPLHLADAELAPGRYVRFSVRDEGTGMTPEVLARLFEPFFTTKPKGKGSGLGLATAYGIIRAGGGAVEVESAPGRGSTFSVYLPAQNAASDAAERAPTTFGRGRGETVLLVEDEAPLRQLLRRVLEQNGYAVLEAANGADALALSAAHRGPLDLLLTDVMMPEMDGFELGRRLRKARPSLRVLHMTGYSEAASAPPEGARVLLLQKPFSTSRLLEQARQMLDAPPPETAGPVTPRG